jgi:hypothetical protein
VHELLFVCKAWHLPARRLHYAKVDSSHNYQQFLIFLKCEQDRNILRYIRTLRFKHSEEPYDREEFKFAIQTLKSLGTLEIKESQMELYLDVMLNDMQVKDLKQIRYIFFNDRRSVEVKRLYIRLVHKLHDTITNFIIMRVYTYFDRQLKAYKPRLSLDCLSKLKKLTQLSIYIALPEGMEFFDILRVCPKLQSLLSIASSVAEPPIIPSNEVVIKNLKRLDMNVHIFPRLHAKNIMSCIPSVIDTLVLSIAD